MKIIDCHTHLQSNKIIGDYFKNRNYYAISIKALDSLIGNGDIFYETTKNQNNIFICECIDALKPIPQQLENIEQNLKLYKIIGIKIYLGYQPIYADDEKLFEVYKFAEAHGLTMVFHCGLCAENLNSTWQLSYSSCIPIGKVAKKFPKVNFVVSHFDCPNYLDCAKVITENSNVYTDISGEYENFENRPAKELVDEFVKDFKVVFEKYSINQIAEKTMFGTDYFGIGSGFELVEEYLETIEILFGKDNYNKCVFDNCLKAYPKLAKEYLK